MAEQLNFLEYKYPAFSDRVIDAAANRTLNAEPLIRELERINDVMRGLEQVFKIARTNTVQSDCFADREDGEAVEPPLSKYAIDSLLGLGQAAAGMALERIEQTASWADKHGVEERR
ncbi:hypothetical protein [Caballeronia sp. INSB1]|uniref:hypothetical protein n=1 Tax=Caballeronia sp. INSB1 TaxID=2921751 RepID=UPI0020325F85|nr:hypothetical protein [Caballeronia sp. INSB1]